MIDIASRLLTDGKYCFKTSDRWEILLQYFWQMGNIAGVSSSHLRLSHPPSSSKTDSISRKRWHYYHTFDHDHHHLIHPHRHQNHNQDHQDHHHLSTIVGLALARFPNVPVREICCRTASSPVPGIGMIMMIMMMIMMMMRMRMMRMIMMRMIIWPGAIRALISEANPPPGGKFQLLLMFSSSSSS